MPVNWHVWKDLSWAQFRPIRSMSSASVAIRVRWSFSNCGTLLTALLSPLPCAPELFPCTQSLKYICHQFVRHVQPIWRFLPCRRRLDCWSRRHFRQLWITMILRQYLSEIPFSIGIEWFTNILPSLLRVLQIQSFMKRRYASTFTHFIPIYFSKANNIIPSNFHNREFTFLLRKITTNIWFISFKKIVNRVIIRLISTHPETLTIF